MIRHVAGIAEIVENVNEAVTFYRDVLGLQVEPGNDRYAVVTIPGVIHFGLWSRVAAAEATFGDPTAIDRIQLGFTVGLEVDSVEAASENLGARGAKVAQAPKREPWGQMTSRFLSPSGALCELSETPNARSIAQDLRVESEAE